MLIKRSPKISNVLIASEKSQYNIGEESEIKFYVVFDKPVITDKLSSQSGLSVSIGLGRHIVNIENSLRHLIKTIFLVCRLMILRLSDYLKKSEYHSRTKIFTTLLMK